MTLPANVVVVPFCCDRAFESLAALHRHYATTDCTDQGETYERRAQWSHARRTEVGEA